MKYETEKDWCLRLYAFVGLGYLATYYVLAKFAAPLRWRDLCFFPAGCYEVVFSWQAVAAAVVSAVQAMFLACSRLRAAKLMWLCAAGWLGAAAFGVLPLLLPHVWEPRGGFPDGLILCSLWLLQSFVYFVLKWRNKGDFSLGLLLLALEPIVSFASCLTVDLRSPALLVLFTGLLHQLMLVFAYLSFLRHPVVLDGSVGCVGGRNVRRFVVVTSVPVCGRCRRHRLCGCLHCEWTSFAIVVPIDPDSSLSWNKRGDCLFSCSRLLHVLFAFISGRCAWCRLGIGRFWSDADARVGNSA